MGRGASNARLNLQNRRDDGVKSSILLSLPLPTKAGSAKFGQFPELACSRPPTRGECRCPSNRSQLAPPRPGRKRNAVLEEPLIRLIVCIPAYVERRCARETDFRAAAADRPRAYLRRSRDCRRADLARRPFIAFLKPWKDTRNVYVKARRRTVQRRPPADHGDQAARAPATSGPATASTFSM